MLIQPDDKCRIEALKERLKLPSAPLAGRAASSRIVNPEFRLAGGRGSA